MRNSFDPTFGFIEWGLRLVMYAVIVWLVVEAVRFLVMGGALYGAAISLRNYGLAFTHNVPVRRSAP